VRGKWTATALAQIGTGCPPPEATGGIRFQHSWVLSRVTFGFAPDEVSGALAGQRTARTSKRIKVVDHRIMGSSSRLKSGLEWFIAVD
jgi:hypothetical protein